MTRAATADPWREVSAARIPAAHLDALAPVRDDAAVRVRLDGEAAWVLWPAGRPAVVRCLLPVPGVEFFFRRDDLWFPFGRRLPAAGPPAGDDRPLAAMLAPTWSDSLPPEAELGPPLTLRVVRGGEPRPAAALACRLAELAAWADRATTMELHALHAARAGERVVLLGRPLPAISSATRFWGDDLLVPVGFRPDPDLPAATLRTAVGAAADELVVLDEAGAEIVPRSAFAPLTRAGVRLALRGLSSAGESP